MKDELRSKIFRLEMTIEAAEREIDKLDDAGIDTSNKKEALYIENYALINLKALLKFISEE